MNTLKFATLRAANIKRLPQFKNRWGEAAHSQEDGSDWKLSAWVNATAGEAGELADVLLLTMVNRSLGIIANEAKKIERGEYKSHGDAEESQRIGDHLHDCISNELADVVTYLDILAFRFGIDLGQAVVSKFNCVSERVKSDVLLPLNDADIFYRQLRSLCGFVENGSSTDVTISQDDATKEWWVKVGSTPGYGGADLRAAIANAYVDVDEDNR